jgi:enoyl-CoA hydratase
LAKLGHWQQKLRRSAVMIDEDLRYEVSDQIAEVSLARRPANALSLSLLEQLIAAFERAAVDENVRAVVLTSAVPRLFSAGLDLGMMLGKSATEVRQLLHKLYVELADVQYNLGKPSIAAVGRLCAGWRHDAGHFLRRAGYRPKRDVWLS